MSPTRRLRLVSGLVLFAYVTTHFLNTALGLVSLDAMEAGRYWFVGFWRTSIGTVLLYGSLLTHIALAFWALYERRTLRMPLWEAAQLALGLCIPPLLMGHVFGTRISWELLGVEDRYSRLTLLLWATTPELGRKQILTLLVAWTHAMIGLHANVKLRPWYPRAAPWLLAFVLLVPVLAVLGFVSGGREAAALARDPAVRAELLWHGRAPLTAADTARLGKIRHITLTTYSTLLGAVLVARAVRGAVERRRGRIRVVYPTNRRVSVPVGLSVLEVSRLAGIQHASVCGGRGRCSTCRVRIRSARP